MASLEKDHVAEVMTYSWLSNLEPKYEEEYLVAEDRWQSRLTCGNLAVVGVGATAADARQKAAKSLQEEYACMEATLDTKTLKLSAAPTVNSGEHAVAEVQAVAAKFGLEVVFEDLSHDGPTNEPTWHCRAILGSIKVIGSARKKKVAQQEAARNLLLKLQAGYDPHYSQDNNFISILNNYCMKEKLPQPAYEVCVKVGSRKVKLSGTSATKTAGAVAEEMLKLLMGESKIPEKSVTSTTAKNPSLQEPGQTKDPWQDPKSVQNMISSKPTLKNTTATQSSASKDAQSGIPFCKSLESLKTVLMAPPEDYVKKLNLIVLKKNGTLNYIDLDEKTDDGEHQCLLQVSLFPSSVCLGSGFDLDSARNDASRVALKYVQLFE